MRKILFLTVLLGFVSAGARAATSTTPWWDQPTICKPNPSQCYPSMGAGFDAGMWDATGNCWGLKLICPAAITPATASYDPVPKSKSDLTAGTGINADFDVSVLSASKTCYGSRKTTANGSQASVNGQWVKVWCNGVLNNGRSPDEVLPTGGIWLNPPQPTCAAIRNDGWVAVLNSQCYGKMYSPSQYFIECTGNAELATRIIVLNGATNFVTGTGVAPAGMVATEDDANALFDAMYTVSQTNRAAHFTSN